MRSRELTLHLIPATPSVFWSSCGHSIYFLQIFLTTEQLSVMLNPKNGGVRTINVLVTGSNGFIGGHLVEHLVGEGHTVHCFVRPESNIERLKNLDVHLVYGDCRDRESLCEAVRKKDYIFHLAGKIRAANWDAYYETNYTGTKNLIEACERVNPHLKRFIHISSIAAAGPSTKGKLKNEEEKCNPLNNYGKTKLLGEEAVQKYSRNIPYVIIRPPNIIGPRERELYTILKIMQKRIKPILGNGEKQTTFCCIQDLVRGIFLAAFSKKAVGKVYYITDGKTYSYREVSDIIAQELGVSKFIIPVPHHILVFIVLLLRIIGQVTKNAPFLTLRRLNHLRHMYMLYDGGKAQQELGFMPTVSLEQGIRCTIDWYRSNGLL